MTTYKIRQHIPGCVDATAKDAEVSSVEELLALPWVKHWEEDTDPWPPNEFYRWSYSLDRGDFYPQPKYWHLMAELRGGAEWWVVAYVPVEMDRGKLPAWDSALAVKLRAAADAKKAAELTSRISDAISDSKE